MIPRDKIAVLLPVYNESAHLEELIPSILRGGFHVLVVDDGSSDRSAELAERLGAKLVRNSGNRGKGYALRMGFHHLLQAGFDWIVIMDSDGQHISADIARFIEKAESGLYGIINGSRLEAPKRMPPLRLWTNLTMSRIVSFVARQEIKDAQCGFKMLSAAFLREARLVSDKFEIEDELLLEAVRLGYRIASVPVTSAYGIERSHIRPIHDTVRFLRFILRRLMRSRAAGRGSQREG